MLENDVKEVVNMNYFGPSGSQGSQQYLRVCRKSSSCLALLRYGVPEAHSVPELSALHRESVSTSSGMANFLRAWCHTDTKSKQQQQQQIRGV
jgi:hypothetical protein